MQPAPFGAQCALHAGVTASAVCTRCGNFMCSACTVGGSEAQCPTCRDLSTGAFPFDANADLSTLFSHSFAAFQREFPMILVAVIIFGAIVGAGGIAGSVVSSIINAVIGLRFDESRPLDNLGAFAGSIVVSQVVSMVINLVVQAVALVGLYRVLTDVLIGRKADVARMFSQLHRFGQFVLLQVIFFVVVSLPMMVLIGAPLAYGAVKVVSRGGGEPRFSEFMDPTVVLMLLVASVLVMVFTVVLLPVMLFSVPELMVSDVPATEAIRRAWVLGEGQRLRLLGYSFVMFAIVMAGALLCCVGMIPATPLAYMLMLALFLALRNSSSLPPANHG